MLGGLQIKPDMIFINDIEVPVPVREVLHGQEYYVANVYVEQFAPQESPA